MSKTLDNALAFPALSAGTAGQVLALNSGGTGYEFQEGATQEIAPPTDWYDIGTRTVMIRDAFGINFDLDQLLPSDTEASVGPVGSGADYEVAALNSIPTQAKGLILYVKSIGASAAAGIATINAGFGRVGASVTETYIYRIDAAGSGEDFASQTGEVVVPINSASPQQFRAIWSASNCSTNVVRISVAGYTY